MRKPMEQYARHLIACGPKWHFAEYVNDDNTSRC